MARKTDIRLRRSNTAGAIPSGSHLNEGELAINTADGALYFKKSDSTVITAHDNTIMHIDSQNDRVGINQSSPTAKLHVKNSANDDNNILLVEAAGSTTYGVYLKSAFSGQMGRIGAMSQSDGDLDGASIAFEDFGRDIAFRANEGSNNTEKMRILANGNVGIGTTSPNSRLEIKGSDPVLTIRDTASPGGTGWTSSDEQLGKIEFWTSDTTGIGPHSVANIKVVNDITAASPSGAIVFHTHLYNSSTERERLRITSAGNVGIGTSSPSELLEVAGDTKVTNLGVNAGPQDYLSSLSARLVVGGNAVINTNSPILYLRANGGSNDSELRSQNGLKFTNGAAAVRAIIASNGNVGIGNSAPGAKLHVSGGDILIDNNNSLSFENAAGAQRDILTYNSSNKVRLDNPGGSTVDLNSDTLIVHRHGRIVTGKAGQSWTNGYSRNITIQNITDSTNNGFGVWNAFIGTNLRYDTTNNTFVRASDQGNSNWGNIAAQFFNGAAGNTDPAIDWVTDIPNESVSDASEVDVSGSTLVGLSKMTLTTGGSLGIGTRSPGSILHISNASSPEIRLEDSDATSTFNITAFQNAAGALNFNTRQDNGTFVSTDYQIIKNAAGANIHKWFIGNSEKLRLDASGRLGVGTSSPADELHVDGSGDTTVRITTTSTTAEPKLVFVDGSGDYSSLEKVNRDIKIKAFNTDVAYFTNSGRVGIGTSSPGANLDIESDLPTIRLTETDDSTYSEISQSFGYLTINNDAGNSGSGDAIIFKVDNSEKVRFESGGSVLIGNATNFSDANADDLQVGNTTGAHGISIMSNNSHNGNLFFGDNDNNDAGRVSYNHTNNRMEFYTNRSQKVIINSDGDVGIGDNAPSSKLTVKNGASGNVASFSSGTSTSGDYQGITLHAYHINGVEWYGSEIRSILTASNPSYLNPRLGFFTQDHDTYLPADRTEKMSILDNGRVGIGTTTPSSTLHVKSTGNGEIDIERASGAVINLQAQSAKGIIGTDSNHDLDFKTNSGVRLTIDTAGNVGIGDTNPSFPLDVNNTSTRVRFKATTGHSNLELSSIAGRDYLLQSLSNGEFTIHDEDSNTNRLNISTAGAITFNNAYTFPTSIGSAGQILKVPSSGTSLIWADDAGGGSATVVTDTDGDTLIQVEESGDEDIIRFDTAGSQRMVILANGDVGIGINSPGATLDVKSIHEVAARVESNHNNGTYFKILNSDATTGRKAILDLAPANNITGAHIAAEAQEDFSTTANRTADLYFSTRHDGTLSEKMRITSDGKVGIGTTNPSQALSVNGNIYSIGGFVNASGYQLNGTYIVDSSRNLVNIAAITTSGNVTVGGNLTVNGTQTILNTSTLTVDDLNITVADGAADAAAANGAGLTVDGANATWTYSSGDDAWASNKHAQFYTGGGTGVLSVGRTSDQAIRLYADDNYNKIYAFQDADSDTDHFFDLVRSFGGTGRADFRIMNGSTVHMLVDKNGNVGINNTNPAYKLDVGGNTRVGGSINCVSLLQSYSSTFNIKNIAQDQDLNLNVNDGGTDTTAITIKGTTANVGIGTSSPAQKLHVAGTVEVNGNIYFDGSTTGSHQISYGTSTQQPSVAFWGEDHASYPGQVHIIGRSDNASASAGEISFWDYTGSTWNRNMVIKKDGKVGIGVDSPGGVLDVNGTYGDLKVGDPSIGSRLTYYNTTRILLNSNDISFYTNSLTERMRIKNDGKVGIGTNSPKNELHVNGGGYFTGFTNPNGSGVGGLEVGYDGTQSVLQSYHRGTSTYKGININAAHISFRTGGTERARVDGSNFDIESGGFRVNDSGNNYPFTVTQYGYMTSRSASITQLNGTGDHANVPLSVLADVNTTRTASYVEIGNIGAAGNKFKIDSAGNVGVGVTSIPSWANFMTHGTVAVGGILYIKQDQKIQALTAYPGGAGYLRINPDGGNVGIGMGTSTPKAKLQIEEYGIDTSETTTTATTQVAIHSFPKADFRTARFTIQITNTTDSTYHSTEIIAVHDGTTANITEFGEVHTGSSVEATFDADISSNNFRLLATPASTDSMTFKVVCHSITV